jgi:hypothetical protein
VAKTLLVVLATKKTVMLKKSEQTSKFASYVHRTTTLVVFEFLEHQGC